MHIRLQERLQSLKLLAGLASFLKNPGSLDSVFAVGNSVKDGPLGEHHGARGFDHPPDYHSDDAVYERRHL